ncbi:MAG: CpaD family pilus assembly lipoprotein [Pseudorhodoplanes sp.]|nr:CpaD family pilus assembly lipoprotein [Pseudorhodoplanes sp.]MCQ3942163.1 pilus assembly protein CpaD [Alphaproteobacteria bacterium]
MTIPISPLRLLLAAALATMLTGCYVPKETASIPNDYRKRHPIALKEGERTVEVFVGNNRGGLTPVQRAEVMSFAQTWRRESTGGVIVDLPSGTPNERAAAEALREIRSILTVSGIPPKAVSVRPYATGADKLASIRLNYSKITAQVGPCGLWPEDLGPSNTPAYQDNRPYWNFGCATQRNLAAMVENPADLVQPRGEIPAYTPRRTVVLDKYRKGESTPTTFNNDDKGKLSDIGK